MEKTVASAPSTSGGSSKHALVIPTMAEIHSVPRNGYNVVSTFSGCGGSCLEFEMDGYRTLWANEFSTQAARTYQVNHRGVPLDRRDIRLVCASEIQAARRPGEIDVLEGSPPCASFSEAGHKKEGWGKVKRYNAEMRQRTDDLFFHFARIVHDLQPKVFVAENTLGLVRGYAKGHFKIFLSHLREQGYRVEAKLLDAMWLGVPQRRQRLFFIGVRKDLGLPPVFPQPYPWRYVMADVLPHVAYFHRPGLTSRKVPRPWYNAKREVANAITTHAIRSSKKAWFSSSGMVELVDGTRRRLTVDEIKVLHTYPEDFELTGNVYDAWERVGRSVPPRMMYEVAKTIRTGILERCIS